MRDADGAIYLNPLNHDHDDPYVENAEQVRVAGLRRAAGMLRAALRDDIGDILAVTPYQVNVPVAIYAMSFIRRFFSW
jgi:hypothetical protein